jgi:hypothetical protein
MWHSIDQSDLTSVRVAAALDDEFKLAFDLNHVERYPTHAHLIAALGRDATILRLLCQLPGNVLTLTSSDTTVSIEDVEGRSCYMLSSKTIHGSRRVWIDTDRFLIMKVWEEFEADEILRLGRAVLDEGELTAMGTPTVSWNLEIHSDSH